MVTCPRLCDEINGRGETVEHCPVSITSHHRPLGAAAHMGTTGHVGQKEAEVCSFLSPFPPKSRALLEDSLSHSLHHYTLSTVHLPAGRRHKFQGSKLLSNTPVSSSCLPRCRNTIQLTVDIISFLCFSTFKLLSNTNAFSSHSHMLNVLNSFE